VSVVPAQAPLCAEVSAALDEPVGATASRVERWLLVEWGGHWPYHPLDASVFAGEVREHLAAQLAALPHARLLLVKRGRRAAGRGVRVFLGSTPERGRSVRRLELDDHRQLLELDLTGDRPIGEPLGHPLFLVCTHGVRDRCCARYGQALCRELSGHAPSDWVWQASHVGGDRFAGNLVILPEGVYFGRLGRPEARAVLADYLEGGIALDRYRGVSCQPFVVQAAELHVRRLTGLRGFYDLRVLGVRRTEPDRWTVELLAEVAGEAYTVEVAAKRDTDARYLTCRATAPRQARRFVVTG